ncbi:uncharacterized protein si:ch211-248a14.8 isoform X2 [Corythoichthys intestinalis]|nr:uncharacterized protein si:ch211-248a14.8 isoform X2 [Corythoichthys intestinalis]
MRRMTVCHSGIRWRSWGWCKSTARTFSSKHALKPMLPALCVVLFFLYGLVNKLRSFVAGIFLPQYHYPYVVALCFGQVLLSLFFLNLFHILGLAPLRPYNRPLAERVLVPAICSSVHAVLTMWAEASGSYAGLSPLSLPLLPVITVGLSFVLKVTALPSAHSFVLLSILTGSSLVFTASCGISVMEPLEYVYTPLAVILLSLSLTWLAKAYEAEHRCLTADNQSSVLDVYYNLVVNQCWLLGLLWTLHPDSPLLVLSRGSWHSLLFHGYLLAILLLGMLLDFAIVMSALSISPLAAALLHSARELVHPFVHMLGF